MITCLKRLTSGYVPLGAVMVSDRPYRQIAEKMAGRFRTEMTPCQLRF